MRKREQQQFMLLGSVLFITTIGLLFYFIQDTQQLDKVEISKKIEEVKHQDNLSLKKFQNNIEELYRQQKEEIIEIEPICTEGMINKVHSSISNITNDFETNKSNMIIKKITRLDGYIEHINSYCYKAKLFYMIGKDYVGYAKDKEIQKLRTDTWNLYFDTPSVMKVKIDKFIQTLISNIDTNHKEIQSLLDINSSNIDKILTISNRHKSSNFNKFLK